MTTLQHALLDEEFRIQSELIQHYRRDGHVLLPGVCRPEILRSFRTTMLNIVEAVRRQQDSQGRIEDYSNMFTQVTNVWRMHDDARRFVFAQRFARIAAELMGVEAVRLYHDQALIKEPGGKPTPWHQDYYYWPLDTEHTVTMWLALVDIPRSMGSMSFVSGSHKNAAFTPMPISDTSQSYFENIIREQKAPVVSYELKAGDATFHSGRLLHSAHGNTSTNRREVMTIIYYADGTRLLEPDNEHRKVDMEVFHPGQHAGEFAASELNPVVFRS